MTPHMQIAGVILAGGESRRMGGQEKALLNVGGIPILKRIIQNLAVQCNPVVIIATGDLTRFSTFGITAIPDSRSLGPMAGLAAALDWLANENPCVSHVLSVPCDIPFLPFDLVAQLSAMLRPDTFAACAASGGRLHPVIGLWPLSARHALQESVSRMDLSFHACLAGKNVATVEWHGHPYDPFFNVNTPEDLAEAEQISRKIWQSECFG